MLKPVKSKYIRNYQTNLTRCNEANWKSFAATSCHHVVRLMLICCTEAELHWATVIWPRDIYTL